MTNDFARLEALPFDSVKETHGTMSFRDLILVVHNSGKQPLMLLYKSTCHYVGDCFPVLLSPCLDNCELFPIRIFSSCT